MRAERTETCDLCGARKDLWQVHLLEGSDFACSTCLSSFRALSLKRGGSSDDPAIKL